LSISSSSVKVWREVGALRAIMELENALIVRRDGTGLVRNRWLEWRKRRFYIPCSIQRKRWANSSGGNAREQCTRSNWWQHYYVEKTKGTKKWQP
jgi:hypothetical protein